MEYTVYDEGTGDILFVLSSNSPPDSKNGKYVVGEYDPNLYRVVDGRAVKKPENEIKNKEIEDAWIKLRRLRDGKLKESDWTQAPDAPVNTQAWANYRKELRDLPSNTSDPTKVVWPEKPKG